MQHIKMIVTIKFENDNNSFFNLNILRLVNSKKLTNITRSS